ncbi:hypothetical protein [Photobacterium sanguinicancri]|uniref:Uncharacterized protein n=1 Tax=Photobacterium sanguinicancri TaxID=875932 RepID=A0AAW7Y6N4_9GAMM|nr:hypothetical protein [Photobacterium sanguinicancri]MDO6542553.1 hypothetical protein [Photobacterium sanguinicancri]
MSKFLFSEMDFHFQIHPLGLERNVRGAWELGIKRFHGLSSELPPSAIDSIDKINAHIGVNPINIDLAEFKESYRTSVELSHVLQEDNAARWVWFSGVEALKDSNYAGWLRSLLTTRDIENLRVVFIIKTRADYLEIFQNSQAPLYKSTLPLQTIVK